MTIWFSTNIPEMRAISAFNRVSTDIADIQQRITTGQRINSGRDDPGGLVIREGLRADIKGIHGAQAGMVQAEIMTNIASTGMIQLLELLVGSDPNDPNNRGLIGELSNAGTTEAQKKEFAENFMKLYNAVISTATYNGDPLLDGTLNRTYQLGDGTGTLTVTIANLTSKDGAALALANEIAKPLTHASDPTFDSATVLDEARKLQDAIAGHLGTLGGNQSIVAMNQRLLDSRLTTLTAAEGRISNTDIALESSRMARAELLAQNAMNSIMYNRRFAAFSVGSLFG